MLTIKIDILNEKVLNLLWEWERLKLIKLRGDEPEEKPTTVDWTRYKGAMSKQSPSDIDRQLNELRSEWD